MLWSFETGAQVLSSPAIGLDGNLYIGSGARSGSSATGAFYAVSPVGGTNWMFTVGTPVVASPLIGPDRTVYVACDNGNVYALTSTGSTNWVFRTGGRFMSSPALAIDGTLYVVSFAAASPYVTRLHAISPAGTTNWVFAMGPSLTEQGTTFGSAQFPSPSIGRDGTVYLGSLDGHVYAISPSGKMKWGFYLGISNNTYSSPTIGPDGTIFIGSDGGMVYALTPDGKTKWSYSTHFIVESSPTLLSSNTLLIGSLDGSLYCLGTGGTKLWSSPIGTISATPALSVFYPNLSGGGGSNADIYLTTVSPSAICDVSPAGGVQWKFTLTSYGFSSPAIGADGTVYVGGNTRLFALYGTNALADGSWPMFRRDLRHQARAVQCAIQPPQVLPDGTMALGLTVETDRTYAVQVSSNLLNWDVLTNLTSSAFNTQVLDLDATNSAQRYYRLMAP